MSLSSPFDLLQMPKDLACEFFAVFSRFEFAMKESGYVYINRRNRAAPDWTRFASDANGFLQVPVDSDLSQAINFLNNDPPQVQTSAHLWQPLPLSGVAPIGTALDAAQRVRNNLFHGGKYAPHSSPGRDEALVRAALVLLLACLSQNNHLGSVYG
jgi:hypothetical protein